MSQSQYDVVVVGAGCAGLTAAIGLARAGLAVAVVEAADFPGAENWSGCVYFCENLAEPDILGPDGVEALAWERRLVERGLFTSDGHGLLGMTYRDPAAFRHCYTVLRPVFDHHLAQVALRHGVSLLNATTAESLIRDDNRVVGICTNRGALYGDLVFLAEGDASHLVTREGYERYADPREAPEFLQGIKQVIELPPGAIEERFQVGAEEGVAYDLLLRNGTLRGKNIRLNMGGFIYANRTSLSIGLVLPAANLHDGFGGDPSLLVEWLESLPALRPWLRDGKRGAFGAKIIRGGGAKDIPILIDDGLAIGGAASAIGIDFPYPNFTGPATAMGVLIARAATTIRAEGGDFTRDNLRKHYLEPLQRTHYWQDVEFLRRWPGYVKKTRVFFGPNLDLALGSAYIWTQPRRGRIKKWFQWQRLLAHVSNPKQWPELQEDFDHLARALRLRTVVKPPSLGQLLLDSTVNALRDIFRRPRANLRRAGDIRLHYSVAGAESSGPTSGIIRRWLARLAPVIASAAKTVYSNDTTPLSVKLQSSVQLLFKQVNVLDVLTGAFLSLAAGVTGTLLATWDRIGGLFRKAKRRTKRSGIYAHYARSARQAGDLTPLLAAAGQRWEERLGQLEYQTVKTSHIHVLWPQTLPDKNDIVKAGLWHVCPAHVYEARVSTQGQVQIVVNFENCIKCETCWRISPLVDWGRDGRHRFVYPAHSPAVRRLIAEADAAGLVPPGAAHSADWWANVAEDFTRHLPKDGLGSVNGEYRGELAEIERLLTILEKKLKEFDDALDEEPRTVDRARADYLEMLARYAHQAAARAVEIVRSGRVADTLPAEAQRPLLRLATALAAKAEERLGRACNRRLAWAAADGRQLSCHHLLGLRRLLGEIDKRLPASLSQPSTQTAWLRAEDDADLVSRTIPDLAETLDRTVPATIWRALEHGGSLDRDQEKALRELVARVPPVDPAGQPGTLHPPVRKAILAELARRDPSLAYRVASHLWARDLALLASGSPALADWARRWAQPDELACFAPLEAPLPSASSAEALFVPAAHVQSLLVLWEDRLLVLALDEHGQSPGVTIERIGTLGLRGAGLTRVRLDRSFSTPDAVNVDADRVRRIWHVLSAADLTSIAFGMADVLCERATAHAAGRVQFPGLFHDEEARDTIGKFGAVKKMLAEMAAGRYAIETLDHALSPVDFSASSGERAGLVKAVVAEVLGTAPGSLSYNAGQVFGGTGYSEDDVLGKLYRDAAAWRFLGANNRAVFLAHGEALLRRWRPDGQRLAALEHEAQVFEDLAQRKALQAELDEVRVIRARLREIVGSWQSAARSGAVPGNLGSASAEVAELLGRQDAWLLATKALLLRTHARLEEGRPAEVEITLVRVWLDRSLHALDEMESRVKSHVTRPSAAEDWAAGAPLIHYSDFLAAPNLYDAGDFLCRRFDLARPHYVPEMNEADPDLARRDRELRTLFQVQFGQPRDGRVFERYIESRHRPDAADLDFCRKHGFFRMPIPTSLGGEGRRKVDYYLLTTNAQRLADVAISLTIQANTSIGTTPVLLARDKDIPKAQKDLGPFVGDPASQQEIAGRLEQLLTLLEARDPKKIQRAFLELQGRLSETVFSRPALKSLASDFVESWQLAARLGKSQDPAGAHAALAAALAAWKRASAAAPELHAELARRREACDLFLRWVAAGQISAFALTEPSAGSDTARVATRAQLQSVPVDVDADGVLHFVPAGTDRPRYLLDARRLEFRDASAFYRWSDDVAPAPVDFDEYDYETDDPRKTRSYDHGKRRIHFTDIAQLRQRDGRLWYDYYEMTGAKMWITNGRMSGIMCLYAKTDRGVTGFIVDRHAEGLVVGKDEDKLGQCGSPTNELSLQAVRVPRENVLGLEGRGQVNALETLNVGRAGLAMSAMAQMPGLIDASRSFALARHRTLPAWVEWRLERMEEDRFTAEALAHDVIGRFEHPQTRSARMESAISKMLVSELLHRMIETAEEIHELPGQTTDHLVEKRKRDARVLNIYEGTNEVQRFSILKDLAAEVAPRWRASAPPQAPPSSSGAVQELDALKAAARQQIDAALGLFSQDLWQNPSLQANCFLLAEVAAWLAAAESTLARLVWLAGWKKAEAKMSGECPAPGFSFSHPRHFETGQRALERCFTEIRLRLRRFEEAFPQLRHGYYAPEIRAASLLFERLAKPELPVHVPSSIARPFSVLVILEPSAAEVPHPHVEGGCLREAHYRLTAPDRAALETALRLRDEAAAPVTIAVAAVGPSALAQVLREALSLGVNRAHLLIPDAGAVPADWAAAVLADVLRPHGSIDLILGGSGGTTGEEGTLASLAGEALGMVALGNAAAVAIVVTGQDETALLFGADRRKKRLRSLPGTLLLEPGLSLRSFSVQGYVAGLGKQVQAHRWPKAIPIPPASFVERNLSRPGSKADDQPHPVPPAEVGGWLLKEMGFDRTGEAAVDAFPGTIQDVTDPRFTGPDGNVLPALIVLAADGAGRLRHGAERAVQAGVLAARLQEPNAEAAVILLTPPDDRVQRQALAHLSSMFQGEVLLVPLPALETSDEVRCRLLVESLGTSQTLPPVIVGEVWTEAAFVKLGMRSPGADGIVPRVVFLGSEDGRLVLETTRARGKLHLRQVREILPEKHCWITLTENAEVAPLRHASPQRLLRATRWTRRLEGFYDRTDMKRLIEEMTQDSGLVRLADADFIIDVGFGVGNRDGYEEVIEPLVLALRDLGVRSLVVGGSRKVTEELHLLPADRQIGQSGVSVNPQVVLAIGISGAPQHIGYIGPRAKILAFNRDPEAPLMTLNRRQPQPKVYPVLGDLFETVPALTLALRGELAGTRPSKDPTRQP